MKEKDLAKYYKMLSYMRPAGSKGERDYLKRFIDNVKGMSQDKYGNRYVVVNGDTDKVTTMFSSHTDTVHRESGRQKLFIDDFTKSVFSNGANCLGADDTTGNFIMLTMISHKIPGLYVFHQDEEIGGMGSEYFSREVKDYWPDLERCIAFDRQGLNSVITHQLGRCCSDAFADALAEQLSTKKRTWVKDSTGVFTDSANYVDEIPECTNLSVGYYNEHTTSEYQDTKFLIGFINKVLEVDWDSLPTIRDVNDVSDPWWEYYQDECGYGNGYGNRTTATTVPSNVLGTRKASSNIYDDNHVGINEHGQWDNEKAYYDVEQMVWEDPATAVKVLCDYYGVNEETVLWKRQKKA